MPSVPLLCRIKHRWSEMMVSDIVDPDDHSKILRLQSFERPSYGMELYPVFEVFHVEGLQYGRQQCARCGEIRNFHRQGRVGVHSSEVPQWKEDK